MLVKLQLLPNEMKVQSRLINNQRLFRLRKKNLEVYEFVNGALKLNQIVAIIVLNAIAAF